MNDLESLYQVQQLDTRIFELRDRIDNHPLRAELQVLEEEERGLESELREAEASLQESRKKMARLESEVQALEEKTRKEEEKLYGGKVTNPKELRGLQAEVRSLGKQKDALETELLEEMERQEELKGGAEALRSRLEELQREARQKRDDLEGEVARLEEELAALEEERDGLRSGIDVDLLELYDRLLSAKQNLAVVKVLDGVCQGCRVELPGKDYDRFLKSEDVFRCTNCGRILVK